MSAKVSLLPVSTRDLDPALLLNPDAEVLVAGDTDGGKDPDPHRLFREWRRMNEELLKSIQHEPKTVIQVPRNSLSSIENNGEEESFWSETNSETQDKLSFIGNRETTSFSQKRYDYASKSTARSRRLLMERARQVERKIEFNSASVTPCQERVRPVPATRLHPGTDKGTGGRIPGKKWNTLVVNTIKKNKIRNIVSISTLSEASLHSITPSRDHDAVSSFSGSGASFDSVYASTAVPPDDIEEQYAVLQQENQERVSIMMEYVKDNTELYNMFIGSVMSTSSLGGGSEPHPDADDSYEKQEEKASGFKLKPGKERYIKHLVLLAQSMENRVKVERFRENKMLLLSYYQQWRYQIAVRKLNKGS